MVDSMVLGFSFVFLSLLSNPFAFISEKGFFYQGLGLGQQPRPSPMKELINIAIIITTARRKPN